MEEPRMGGRWGDTRENRRGSQNSQGRRGRDAVSMLLLPFPASHLGLEVTSISMWMAELKGRCTPGNKACIRGCQHFIPFSLAALPQVNPEARRKT
jgi:hypothetical protein